MRPSKLRWNFPGVLGDMSVGESIQAGFRSCWRFRFLYERENVGYAFPGVCNGHMVGVAGQDQQPCIWNFWLVTKNRLHGLQCAPITRDDQRACGNPRQEVLQMNRRNYCSDSSFCFWSSVVPQLVEIFHLLL